MRRGIRTISLFLLMGLWVSQAFCSTQLTAMDVKEGAGVTHVYFSFNGKVKPQFFSLTHPDRIVVDFSKATMGFDLKDKSSSSPKIKAIRTGRPNDKSLRIVFELKEPFDFKTAQWQPQAKGSQGIRMDLLKKQNSVSSEKKAILVHHSPSKSMRDVVVIIDAGHGGKDPGAHGLGGSKEKNVVLAIALKLKKLIDKQPGMKAVLTRKGDYYVGLRDRLNIARKHDGDIFVAIHADAYINHESQGASVFALSQRGATSEAARWIAEKENYSELGGVDLSELDDQNGVVRSVLIDLSQTATIGASLEMGQRLLSQLDKITTLHHNKVEQARFVVLKSPDIPSVLVETGFISNPREEKNLNSSAYQERLSLAIFRGLKQYFMTYPPAGTMIEAMTEGKIHVVKAGETLSSIAQRYKISMSRLLSANQLSAKIALKAGQTLKIPTTWA